MASEACNISINKTASRDTYYDGEFFGHGASESHAVAVPATMDSLTVADIQRHMIVVRAAIPSTGVGINQNIARLQGSVCDYVATRNIDVLDRKSVV